jgi:hypothetical protein
MEQVVRPGFAKSRISSVALNQRIPGGATRPPIPQPALREPVAFSAAAQTALTTYQLALLHIKALLVCRLPFVKSGAAQRFAIGTRSLEGLYLDDLAHNYCTAPNWWMR